MSSPWGIRVKGTFSSSPKDVILGLGESLKHDLCALKLNATVVGNVATHARKLTLPDSEERVDGALADLERRKVRQEVITDEEDEENPVVHCALEIKWEGRRGHIELDLEVLAKDTDVEEDEGLRL